MVIRGEDDGKKEKRMIKSSEKLSSSLLMVTVMIRVINENTETRIETLTPSHWRDHQKVDERCP
jgi:hypothetical protein